MTCVVCDDLVKKDIGKQLITSFNAQMTKKMFQFVNKHIEN